VCTAKPNDVLKGFKVNNALVISAFCVANYRFAFLLNLFTYVYIFIYDLPLKDSVSHLVTTCSRIQQTKHLERIIEHKCCILRARDKNV
jgi:hypothetical protein